MRQSDAAGGKRSLRSSLPDKSRAVLCNSPEDQRLDSFFRGRGGPLISAGANRCVERPDGRRLESRGMNCFTRYGEADGRGRQGWVNTGLTRP